MLGQGNCNAIYTNLGNVWQELNTARFPLSQLSRVHLLCAAYLKLRYNKSHFSHTERALGKQGCLTILLSIKPVSLRISGRNSTEFQPPSKHLCRTLHVVTPLMLLVVRPKKHPLYCTAFFKASRCGCPKKSGRTPIVTPP